MDDNSAKQWSHEFRLGGAALEDSLDWVVGIYLFEEEASNSLDVPILRGAVAPGLRHLAGLVRPFGHSRPHFGPVRARRGANRRQPHPVPAWLQRLQSRVRRSDLALHRELVRHRRGALYGRRPRFRARRIAFDRHTGPHARLSSGHTGAARRHHLLHERVVRRSDPQDHLQLERAGRRHALSRMEQGLFVRRLQPGREDAPLPAGDLGQLGEWPEIHLEGWPGDGEPHGVPQQLREPADHGWPLG